MSRIYFYNVPQAIHQAFSQSGLNPIPVTDIPLPDSQVAFLWYVRTEEEIMIFDKVAGFGRKIILAPESLVLENPSVTALLLRQNNIELYLPFTAAHIPDVLSPIHHWYSVESPKINSVKENIPVLFSGSGKDSVAIWGPRYSGKTSLLLSMGAALAKTKAKVLIIDATNDADLLYWIEDNSNVSTMTDVYDRLVKHDKPKIHQFLSNLHIIPGNLNKAITPDQLLYIVDSLRNSFNFILFDVSSNPNDTGYAALQLVSRILLVGTVDIPKLYIWHESVFKTFLLPSTKMSSVINASFASRYQKRDVPLTVLDYGFAGHVPVIYEDIMDAQIKGIAPYSISKNEEYKQAIDNVVSYLWPVEVDISMSLIEKIKDKFLGGRR